LLRTLLIDDEVSARTDLRAKLAAHPEVEIVGEASTLRAARALLETADYDLVFLDVLLIGGDSFPLVPLVRPGATLIFATAYERYALRAFESRAVDYLYCRRARRMATLQLPHAWAPKS
jgi:two-component system LytT family response regulator